jgi:uncharacterized SAM-binding protein YcdF (DUF218 family)
MYTPRPLSDALRADAKALWDFHRLDLPYEKADVVLGLGSYDPAVAEHAADLFLKGYGTWLMFTGLAGNNEGLLKTPWTSPEATIFREIAVARGVPAASIVTECQATNTSENLRFATAELNRRGIAFSSLIIVTKPNMERRVRATGKKCIANVAFSVTSPPFSFEEYCFSRFEPATIINLMVGDLQRLDIYPRLGFQETETIPDAVRSSYERLVAAGFTKHLIDTG